MRSQRGEPGDEARLAVSGRVPSRGVVYVYIIGLTHLVSW